LHHAGQLIATPTLSSVWMMAPSLQEPVGSATLTPQIYPPEVGVLWVKAHVVQLTTFMLTHGWHMCVCVCVIRAKSMHITISVYI